MSQKARCKFTVQSVEGDPATNATVKMETEYDEELSNEDAAFSQATPWGDMTFAVSNPNLADFFEEGKSYYVDISPVEE